MDLINVYGHTDFLVWVRFVYDWKSNQIEINEIEDGSVGTSGLEAGWAELYFSNQYNSGPLDFMSWMIREGVAPRQKVLLRLKIPTFTPRRSSNYGFEYNIDSGVEVVRVLPTPDRILATRISRVLQLIRTKERSYRNRVDILPYSWFIRWCQFHEL